MHQTTKENFEKLERFGIWNGTFSDVSCLWVTTVSPTAARPSGSDRTGNCGKLASLFEVSHSTKNNNINKIDILQKSSKLPQIPSSLSNSPVNSSTGTLKLFSSGTITVA